MLFIKRFLLKRKFNKGFYSLHSVELSEYEKNKDGEKLNPRRETVNGYSRVLSESEIHMYNQIPIKSLTSFDGIFDQYNSDQIFTILKAGCDTGIRLNWNIQNRFVVGGGGIKAVNIKTEKVYESKVFAWNERLLPVNFAVELILNEDFWMTLKEYHSFLRAKYMIKK